MQRARRLAMSVSAFDLTFVEPQLLRSLEAHCRGLATAELVNVLHLKTFEIRLVSVHFPVMTATAPTKLLIA
jgi:hypothetical protein